MERDESREGGLILTNTSRLDLESSLCAILYLENLVMFLRHAGMLRSRGLTRMM